MTMVEEKKKQNLFQLSLHEPFFRSLKTYEQGLVRYFEKSIESAIQCKLSIHLRNVENKPTSNENRSDSPRVGRNGRERGRQRNGRGKERFNSGRKFTNAFLKCNIWNLGQVEVDEKVVEEEMEEVARQIFNGRKKITNFDNSLTHSKNAIFSTKKKRSC